MPLCLDEGMAALPIYYIGKITYPNINNLRKNICLNIIGTFCLVLFILHVLSFTIVPTTNGLFKPFYPIPLIGILLVFIPVLSLSVFLKKVGWLAKFGQHSLGIMLTHAMMCHTAAVILNRLFEKGNTVWVATFLVVYILICACSYILTVFVERHFPVLLGKRQM